MSDQHAVDLVRAIRQAVLRDVERQGDDAHGVLEAHQATVISPAERSGEWDWYWPLNRWERARITERWTSPYADPPDVIADRWGGSIDAAMSKWLHLRRTVDAVRVARVGLTGGTASYDFAAIASLGYVGLDDLLDASPYRLSALVAPMPVAIRHLHEVDAALRDRRQMTL